MYKREKAEELRIFLSKIYFKYINSSQVIAVEVLHYSLLPYPRIWDGIDWWYWCRHRSKDCSKDHRLPSQASPFGLAGLTPLNNLPHGRSRSDLTILCTKYWFWFLMVLMVLKVLKDSQKIQGEPALHSSQVLSWWNKETGVLSRELLRTC